jgi:hypothetical protein
MIICLILIPLFNALVGWLSIVLFLHGFFRWTLPARKASICQAIVQKLQMEGETNRFIEKLKQINLENEVSPLLDKRLDDVVVHLKGQIPMGEMFLSGALAERLKGRVKQEILKSLPEIQECLIQKASELDFKQILEEKVQGLLNGPLANHLAVEMGGELRKLKGMGALLGLIIGLLELPLLVWFC